MSQYAQQLPKMEMTSTKRSVSSVVNEEAKDDTQTNKIIFNPTNGHIEHARQRENVTH